jgi:hypothetical protein
VWKPWKSDVFGFPTAFSPVERLWIIQRVPACFQHKVQSWWRKQHVLFFHFSLEGANSFIFGGLQGVKQGQHARFSKRPQGVEKYRMESGGRRRNDCRKLSV